MSKPAAIRLADYLSADAWPGGLDGTKLDSAAAELRRLHSINAELLEALIAVKEVLDFAIGADLVPPGADGPAVMAANAIRRATEEA